VPPGEGSPLVWLKGHPSYRRGKGVPRTYEKGWVNGSGNRRPVGKKKKKKKKKKKEK